MPETRAADVEENQRLLQPLSGKHDSMSKTFPDDAGS
jgi:hypothetical protein